MTVPFHLNQLPREFGRSEDVYFKITYTKEQYEEVVNSRALEFISWSANVGGFIGMLLGYAFVQIPMLLRTLLESLAHRILHRHQRMIEGETTRCCVNDKI